MSERSTKEGVNLGDDADATGAMHGQLAGAYYREYGIPGRWTALIARASLIENIAESLYSGRTL